jgi:hypothetical protein
MEDLPESENVIYIIILTCVKKTQLITIGKTL